MPQRLPACRFLLVLTAQSRVGPNIITDFPGRKADATSLRNMGQKRNKSKRKLDILLCSHAEDCQSSSEKPIVHLHCQSTRNRQKIHAHLLND